MKLAMQLDRGGFEDSVTNGNRKIDDDRRRYIVDRLNLRRQCTAKALAAELDVSVSTIKRVEREARRGPFWTYTNKT